MNRLITFGCSYTQGIGLDGLDHWAHKNYHGTKESVLKIKSASKIKLRQMDTNFKKN